MGLQEGVPSRISAIKEILFVPVTGSVASCGASLEGGGLERCQKSNNLKEEEVGFGV